MKVTAHVVLEFEDGHKEAVSVSGLEVLGNWQGFSSGQSRPIYDVRHPSFNGVYQHHNVGVALLDALRVAVIDQNPDWCKAGPNRFKQLSRSSAITHSNDVGLEVDKVLEDLKGSEAI